VVIDLVAAKRLVLAIERMVDPNVHYRACIFDISGIVFVDVDARAYFESGTDFGGQVMGVALLSESFIGSNIGNLFLEMNADRDYPVRFFESAMSVEHWLRKNLKQARSSDNGRRHVA